MSVDDLVYISKAQIDFGDTGGLAEVDEIIAHARKRNATVNVTGALLFTEGRFVQALEGDRKQVRATFDRIAADSHRTDVEILLAQFSDRRRFKDWSMAFVGDSEALRARFQEWPLATLVKRAAGDAMLDFMLDLARNNDDR